MNGTKEFYISIDIEADGPIPGKNSMLQLGAAIFDGRSEDHLGGYTANLLEIPGAHPDPETMKWWAGQGNAFARTRVGAREASVVMKAFVDWVEFHAQRLNKKPVLIGYPVTYDFMFVYWYTIAFVGRSPFGFQGLDIKTLATTLLNTDFREASKRKFPKPWMTNLPPHTHNALDDAIEQGIIFTRMLQLLNEEEPEPAHLRPV